MSYNKYFIFLFTISVIFFSCKTENQLINVTNLNEAQGVRAYSSLYALPKTVIKVTIRFEQTISKEGPYSKYAKSLLGIENAISRNYVEWSIKKVDFTTYPVPDTNHIYIIEQENSFENIGLSLTACGLINSINIEEPNAKKFLAKNEKQYTETLNYNPEEEQINKMDMLNFNDVPVVKSVQSKKTEYERAKAMAAKIYTLREDRAAIIVGDGYTEAMPDGLALKEIVENLNNLEQKYLSLFVGKQLKRAFTYSFDFLPDSPKKITQAILFRFSTSKGVVSFNDVSGSPVIIEINSFQNISQIKKFNKKQNYLKRVAEIDEKEHGLYYRIPEMGIVRLLINEKVIAEKKVMLAQFGVVHPLSPQYLNGAYSIEFYPELGSIKQIIKLKNTIKVDE